jgi:hypothetical protein
VTTNGSDSLAPDLQNEHLDELVRRARTGDVEACRALREILDHTPGLWDFVGDLAFQAEQRWLDFIAGDDSLFRDALARKVSAMKTELTGTSSSPLEKLLVGRIIATWLQSHQADASYAQAQGLSLKQAAFAQQRMDAAHRRHLTAIAALTTVRRLLPKVTTPGVGQAPIAKTQIPGESGRPLAVFRGEPARVAQPAAATTRDTDETMNDQAVEQVRRGGRAGRSAS